MNDVFKIFLSLSLSSFLMILILFLCRHLWKGKISRQWQYYIWLIVIARLLPFASETNLMGSVFPIANHTSFRRTPYRHNRDRIMIGILKTGLPPIRNMADRKNESRLFGLPAVSQSRISLRCWLVIFGWSG